MDAAIECFLMRVREKRKQKLLPLGDLDGKGGALSLVCAEALQPMVKGNYKGHPGKSLSLKMSTTPLGFSGVIHSGEYGLASDMIDVTNGSKAFAKGKHHAEQVPFFIRLHVPVGGTQAMLMLQRLGKSGVTTPVRNLIRERFEKRFPNLQLDFQPMVPDFVMKQYLKSGTPKAVTFVKNYIPSDYADKVSGKSEESKGRVEVTIKSSEGSFFQPQKIAQALAGSAGNAVNAVKSVYSFDDFAPDKIKLKVDMGGHTRTINLTNHSNLRATFDINDKVKIGSSGYPNQKDVSVAADDILKQVAAAAGIKL